MNETETTSEKDSGPEPFAASGPAKPNDSVSQYGMDKCCNIYKNIVILQMCPIRLMSYFQ